jgi:hypothetical protein
VSARIAETVVTAEEAEEAEDPDRMAHPVATAQADHARQDRKIRTNVKER